MYILVDYKIVICFFNIEISFFIICNIITSCPYSSQYFIIVEVLNVNLKDYFVTYYDRGYRLIWRRTNTNTETTIKI